MIPAGRQCSFWSSDGVLGNRPVPPPALPISPDIVPQRAGVTTVWFGSFDSLANQPNGPPVSGNAVYLALSETAYRTCRPSAASPKEPDLSPRLAHTVTRCSMKSRTYRCGHRAASGPV